MGGYRARNIQIRSRNSLMDIILQIVGIAAICGVGLAFCFFGALGNSMPVVIVGFIIFSIGAYMAAAKINASVFGISELTHSITITLDMSIVYNIIIGAIFCIASVYGLRAWLK